MITSFQDENRWLSNFWPSPIKCFGTCIAPTVEHAYQASKAEYMTVMFAILAAETPGKAKRMTKAKGFVIRSDWEEIKLDIMFAFVTRKFQIPELRQKLLATGTQELIEGNTWGDKFFGCVWEDGIWVGQNNLGKILMKVREDIKKG